MARVPDDEFERLKQEVSLQRLVEAQGIELKPSAADLPDIPNEVKGKELEPKAPEIAIGHDRRHVACRCTQGCLRGGKSFLMRLPQAVIWSDAQRIRITHAPPLIQRSAEMRARESPQPETVRANHLPVGAGQAIGVRRPV
jgi:hypothetical protein